MNKKTIKSILLYLVTLIIFIILFSKMNFYELLKILKSTSLIFLLIAIFLRAISLIIYADRFKWILRSFELNISLRKAIFLGLSSLPTKLLAPARSGEIVQALYLKRKNNFSLKKGILSLIIRAVFDFLALFFCILSGIIFLRISVIGAGIWILIILLSVLFIFLLILILKKDYLLKIYNYFKEFLNAFKQIQLIKIILLFSYSIIFYLIIFLICFFAFKSLGINIPLKEILFFMPIIFILMQIPITIAGFGTREALIIYFFSKHASAEALLSGALLISFVIYIIPAFVGIFFQKKLLQGLFKNEK